MFTYELELLLKYKNNLAKTQVINVLDIGLNSFKYFYKKSVFIINAFYIESVLSKF